MIAPLLWAVCAAAQDGATSPKPDHPDLAFRVIQKITSDAGDHFVILNRVAPPVLLPKPAPASAPASPPLEAQQAQSRREEKKREALILSATVHGRQLTQLGWSANGRRFTAFSNIDFNLLRGVMEIETEDTVYQLVLGIGNESVQEAGAADAAKQPLPLLSWFSQTRSEYLLVEDENNPVGDGSVAGLDAIHIYFDAQRAALVEQYNQREAARIAKEQWEQEHPPTRTTTVISYWPGENTVYIAQPHHTAKP